MLVEGGRKGQGSMRRDLDRHDFKKCHLPTLHRIHGTQGPLTGSG